MGRGADEESCFTDKKKKVPNVFFLCVWVDLIVCWDNEKELRQMN